MDNRKINSIPIAVESVADHLNSCASSGCGGIVAPANTSEAINQRIHDHPCYSVEAHHHFARMHVAVAPACNIQCNYCNRKYDCANESRPGVVSRKETPEQALRKFIEVSRNVPQLSVVGIAGPGDALANPDKTFKTFELINGLSQDVKLCLSTNGLALPDYVGRLQDYNVDHITITINMIDPEVGEAIYPWVFYKNKRRRGREAAMILAERQLEGLEAATSAGLLVKVNSVLIPGINDHHLPEVSKVVSGYGAFLHNIMPIISAPEHGTAFGLAGQREPTAQELEQVQSRCGGDISIMRHCRQCRSDAIGLLGEDRGKEFVNLDTYTQETEFDPTPMLEYRQKVNRLRAVQSASKAQLQETSAITAGAPERVRVAVATRGNGMINQHFGHAEEMLVYDVNHNQATFVGTRSIPKYCLGGYSDDDVIDPLLGILSDCKYVLVSKIGSCPKEALAESGLEVLTEYAGRFIDSALIELFRDRHIESVYKACC